MSPARNTDPLWLAYKAERAQARADKAQAEADEYLHLYLEALAEFERRFAAWKAKANA